MNESQQILQHVFGSIGWTDYLGQEDLDWMMEEDGEAPNYYAVILTEKFARKFWGSKDRYCSFWSHKGVNMESWEWYLKEMVTEQDKLSYLSRFL